MTNNTAPILNSIQTYLKDPAASSASAQRVVDGGLASLPPLVELLRSAVGAVTRRLHAHDVIAFLKTDLMAGPDLARFRDAVDRLENYALQYGLSGPAWLSPESWTFTFLYSGR